MKYIFLILSFFLTGTYATFSQSNCKVKLEVLSESYKGDCKKGYAHGSGEASGKEDIYKGNFKKGYPHGFGEYNWGNGSKYIGDFSKGKMDGQGVLIVKKPDGTEELKKGYFESNEYIGEYKYPYSVKSKREVKNVYIQEDPSVLHGDLYQITIKVKSNGNYVKPFLMVNYENGSNYSSGTLHNVKYPCKKIEISFKQDGFSSRVLLDIYKKGNWIVEITI